MPAGTSYASVTIAQISDATAFGKAVLAVAGQASKVLSTSAGSAPQLTDPSVTAAQISDANPGGRDFLTQISIPAGGIFVPAYQGGAWQPVEPSGDALLAMDGGSLVFDPPATAATLISGGIAPFTGTIGGVTVNSIDAANGITTGGTGT